MRQIKFRAWHYGAQMWLTQEYQGSCFRWINEGQNITVNQWTGLTDKNGKDIYEGDILNICYTSDGAEYIHDGVYTTSISDIGGIQFTFERLMWESFGHNQYPSENTLSGHHGSLSTVRDENGKRYLVSTIDNYTKTPSAIYPFNEENEYSFASRYFEVIGNIYEDKHLLEPEK